MILAGYLHSLTLIWKCWLWYIIFQRVDIFLVNYDRLWYFFLKHTSKILLHPLFFLIFLRILLLLVEVVSLFSLNLSWYILIRANLLLTHKMIQRICIEFLFLWEILLFLSKGIISGSNIQGLCPLNLFYRALKLHVFWWYLVSKLFFDFLFLRRKLLKTLFYFIYSMRIIKVIQLLNLLDLRLPRHMLPIILYHSFTCHLFIDIHVSLGYFIIIIFNIIIPIIQKTT